MSDMMRAVADFISLAPGIGTPAVDIFGGTRPPKPDNLVAVYQSTGFEPVRAMGRLVMEVINLQIIVRDLDPSVAESKSMTIMLMLDRFVGILSGTKYYSILARHSPMSLGVDENQRTQWSTNFEVRKDPS
jgi:hypothetical protein